MRGKGDRILISSSCIVLSTKKYSHNLKVELFYLVWMFRTPDPGDSISVALRKLLQGGRGWVRLYTGLQHREQAVCTSEVRYQVKASSILCGGGAASGSLPLLLSHDLSCLGPIVFPCSSCFLHPPAPQQSPWEGVATPPGSQFGEPSFTFGGQKSLMVVIFLVY